MRSGLLCVLVITCISAQLYTTNAEVKESNESTQILPKPPGRSVKEVHEQIQERVGRKKKAKKQGKKGKAMEQGRRGNTYLIKACV